MERGRREREDHFISAHVSILSRVFPILQGVRVFCKNCAKSKRDCREANVTIMEVFHGSHVFVRRAIF